MSSQPISILLIEDNPGDARLVHEILVETWQTDFSLTTVDLLSDGINHLATKKTDVILLDLSLPDSHGLETLTAVHQAASSKPIVVLTGLDADGVGIDAVNKGAQDYLPKAYLDGQLLTRTLNHSIARKELEEAERRQRVIAEALRDTAAALISSLDIEVVVQRILEMVGRVVPHDEANIMLIDGDTARTVARQKSQMSIETSAGKHRFSLETRHLQDMRRSGLPVLIENTEACPGWVAVPETDWIKSYVAVPIRMQKRVIGFLNLNSGAPGFFTPDHLPLLQAFADQAAIALENARLYQELEAYNQFLEQAVAERTEKLRESEARYRTIIRNLPDGLILIFDRDLRFIFSAGEELTNFGITGELLLGKTLYEVFAPDTLPLVEKALRRVLQGESVRFEVDIRDQPYVVSAAPLPGPDNKVGQILVLATNITERKQAEIVLRQALAHETNLSEMRMRFLSMASHDLRTPLAVVRSCVDTLDAYADRLSCEQKQAKFDHIRASVKSMVELLDDVLTIGKIEAGKLGFHPEPVDVVKTCETVLNEIQASIGNEHRFEFSADGAHAIASIDEKLIRHVLTNLLSNAIKYSSAGSTVTFDLVCDENQVCFRIQDEGIGIPETDQNLVFEAFHRAKNVGCVSGTGLGLAIVRQFVEQHGGTVTFDSQEGMGTEFVVTIPTGLVPV